MRSRRHGLRPLPLEGSKEPSLTVRWGPAGPKNLCELGGFLVNALQPMEKDPSDYHSEFLR